METVWRRGNLDLAFALELGAIAALGYWGFRFPGPAALRIALGIGAPAVAIVLWALFAAPSVTFTGPVAYALTAALVFGGAATGLWTSDRRVLGILLPVLFVANLAVVKKMRLDTMAAALTTR